MTVSITPPAAAAAAPARQARLALAALAVSGLIMGLAPVIQRFSEVGPLATGLWRLGLAMPVFLAFSLYEESRDQARAIPTLGDAFLIVLTGIFFGVDIAFWHLAVKYTTVSEATLLALLAPIFVTAGAWMWFGERVSRRFLTGLGLALAGTAALILQRETGALPLNRPLGIACALGAALTYGIYLLFIRRLRRAYSVTTIITATTAISALVLVPLSVLEPGPVLPASIEGWAVVLFLAWGSQVFGQGAIAYALAHLSVSFSAMIQFYQAVVAVFAAWLLLGEAMSLAKAACAMAIMAGIWLCRRATAAG